MQCVSCRNEVPQSKAMLVLTLFLCPGCGAMAQKADKELELETHRALELARHTLAQHILRGGLLLPREQQEPTSKEPPNPAITKAEGST